MEVIIREIEERDYPEVTLLLVNDLVNNKLSGDYIVPFLNKVKNDESYKSFVAIVDNTVVGFISTLAMLWAFSESANLYIQGLVVKKEFQNKGIGTKLLKYIENFAKSKEISSILLLSGFKRTEAHAFYERNGYTTMTRHFGKNLTP